MIAKVTVTGDICWPREAYQLIINQVKGQSTGDFLKKQLLKYQIDYQYWDDLYQYFNGIEENFESGLTLEEKELLEKYFTVNIEEIGCIAQLLLFFDDLKINETMEEFKCRMENLTQEEIDQGFDQQLMGLGNIIGGISEMNESTLDSKTSTLYILKHIAELNLSDQEKWQLQEIYIHFREHSKKIMDFLEMVCQLITKDVKKLKKYQDRFQQYWEKRIKTESIYQIIKEDLQLDMNENPMGTVINPNLMQISTIKFAENGEVRSKTLFCLGILFGEEYSFIRKVEEKQNEQDLFVILKLLSDKSKFEILQFTADDWRYGSEIAKTMKLTSATISYHMNTLVQARLVEIKKEEKKIFFRQNKAYLSEMLLYCEKLIQNK